MRRTYITSLLATAIFAWAGSNLPAQENGVRVVTGYANAGQDQAPPETDTYTIIHGSDVYEDIPPGPYQNIWGVFLGIGDYEYFPDLENPPNDARVLAETLSDVSGLRDPEILVDGQVTVSGVQAALERIGAKDKPGDLVIFHYSGHGVGLENNRTGDMRGYMVLQNAGPGEAVLNGNLNGMIDMTHVMKMMELANIDAKHKLVVLDCCFSGFGAEYRTRSLIDRSYGIKTMLSDKAVYIMSAGDSGQEVLDVSVDFQGYGLLSGYMIQALQNPSAFELKTVPFEGRTYVSSIDLFNGAQYVLPYRANNTLDAFLQSIAKEANITPAPSLDDLTDSARIASSFPANVQDVFNQLGRLYGQLQRPQALRRDGRGTVLIPVADNPPTVTPTLPPTPMPDKPTPTPTVTPTPPPPPPTPTVAQGESPIWAKWADDVAKHYGNMNYGEQLKDVLELIYTGEPPKPPEGSIPTITIAADVLARPVIGKETWREIEQYEGWDIRNMSVMDRVNLRKKWRNEHNLGWTVIPHSDYALSEHFGYQFRIANMEERPLHYYMIGIDQAGIIQWVAPENSTWVDDIGNFSSGRTPLASMSRYTFPPANEQTGQDGFQPVMGELDQYFYLVVCTEPWPEMEQALKAACKTSFDLFNNDPRHSQPVTTGQKLEVRMRAAGRVQVETLEEPMEDPTLDYVTRNEGHYRISTWVIDIVPKDQLVPYVRLKGK